MFCLNVLFRYERYHEWAGSPLTLIANKDQPYADLRLILVWILVTILSNRLTHDFLKAFYYMIGQLSIWHWSDVEPFAWG